LGVTTEIPREPESLLGRLKEKGITQKTFAASIGMSTQHLSAVKSSELNNRFYHELGATKLACLWILEHYGDVKSEK
jgi:transcriptional regulator with XRE-family HTH domain